VSVMFANGPLAWPSSKSAQVRTMPTNRRGSIFTPEKPPFCRFLSSTSTNVFVCDHRYQCSQPPITEA